MIFTYKPYPVGKEPGFSGISEHWCPVLNMQLMHRHVKSKRFEAIVDSGSATCLFHGSIARSIGVRIEDGREGIVNGVVPGVTSAVYYHKVKMFVVGQIMDAEVGFSDGFKITFDPSSNPPGMDIERIYRA